MSARKVLSIGMVVYRPDYQVLRRVLSTLAESVCRAGLSGIRMVLIDNSPEPPDHLERLAGRFAPRLRPRVAWGQGNVGYGRGHNLALDEVGTYHLLINPDVEIAPDGIPAALSFMTSHPECGLLAPATWNGCGERQYPCKRHSNLLDLLLRGFAPPWLQRAFSRRLDRYEMRDLTGREVIWDPPMVSGCFMLFRAEVLRRLGGFDPRYFLYFEDFDLSLRAAGITRIAYVPSVRIIHHGGHAARKGLRHILFFGRSAVTFFNHHGWRLY